METHGSQSFLSRSATLHMLFQNMTEGVCINEFIYKDGEAVDYRVIDVNPSFERLTGLTREVAVGAVASELYGTGEAPFLETYRTVAETGAPAHFQVFWPPLEKHFQITVISPKKGTFATLFFDISELKRIEARIQELPVGLFRSSISTGRILECNDYFAKAFGYPDVPACIDGYRTEQHFTSIEDQERRMSILKHHGELRNLELSIRRTDGNTIWVSFSALVHPDQGYIEGAAIEITELKQLQDRVRQSEKLVAIGQLAGGVAHDFNNQLASIVGFADLIVEQAEHNQEIMAYANNILVSAHRATDLNNQLLAFARKGKYLEIPVDIHQLIEEVISLLSHTVDRRIAFRQRIDADDSCVIGDPSQLQNALMNLALNSRDAMPEGGEICFSTQVVYLDASYCRKNAWEIPEGDYLQICVTDNGVGMDKETLSHMFEPFFTTKEKGQGTGMGLAAVYGTVKNHNGTVNVYSEPNGGTTVSIYLPHPHRLHHTISPREYDLDDMPAVPLNVLVVDDEPLVAIAAEEMLRRLGHNSHVCPDGEEALEYYRQEGTSVDLVILDMVMPILNGRDTYTALRNINPDIKVLLSSGYSINGEAQEILDEGGLGFIQKPFRLTELALKIAETMSGEVVSMGEV